MRVIKLFLSLFILLTSSLLFADHEPPHDHQNVVILPAGQVHQGNFFALGRSIEISGTVNGDVYVLAEQVIIDGVVNGDILGTCGSIDVSGKVTQNCRLIAGQALISGSIGNNVTIMAGNLQLLSSASIGGSLVAIAGNVDLASSIGSDAMVIASNVRVSSEVKGNLEAYVGQLRITSRGFIGGNVEYKSNTEAWIEKGATIRGIVTQHPSFVHGLVKGTWIQKLLVGSKVIALLMNFIYTFVIGLILIRMFPKNLEAALHALSAHPAKSLGYGLMLLILLPLVSLILLMTILGVPFALTLIAANIIGFYTAKIYSILWASNWLFGKAGLKPNRLPALFCGMVVYFILVQIPYVGIVIAFAAMLFGVGCGILAQTKRGIFSHG